MSSCSGSVVSDFTKLKSLPTTNSRKKGGGGEQTAAMPELPYETAAKIFLGGI